MFFLHFLNRAGHSFVSHFCQWKVVPLNPSRLSCWNRAEFAAVSFKLSLAFDKNWICTKKKNYGVWSLWPYHGVRLYWSVHDGGSLGSTRVVTGSSSVSGSKAAPQHEGPPSELCWQPKCGVGAQVQPQGSSCREAWAKQTPEGSPSAYTHILGCTRKLRANGTRWEKAIKKWTLDQFQ